MNVYKYDIGNIVNGLKILEQCNIKNGNYFRKGYKYQCLVDNYIGMISESDLLDKKGCPVCSGRVAWIGHNDIHTVAPWMEDWAVNPDDIKNLLPQSSKMIEFKCPVCGSKIGLRRISQIYNQGLSCPCCSDGISHSEKIMYNLLNQLGIDFKYQYSPKWCSYEFKNKIHRGRYDFYIPSKQIIIEMDGALGHGVRSINELAKEESKKIDNIKDNLAKEHNIEVIRIDCNYESQRKLLSFEYIKQNILNSKLCILFDLHNINWILIDKKSQKSLVKIICKYRSNNPKITTSQIANKFKLSAITVSKYLKIGNKLGWCIYDSKKEMIKNGKINGKKNGKKVICVNTNTVYESAYQASEETSICRKSISNCCNGKYKSAGKLNGIKLQWMFLE